MDWIKQLNAALDYIEAELAGEISHQELANIAHCSVYNFQRMFSYLADRSLADYIRSRRLTCAAFDILQSDARLLDIAVKYGYSSQDAFSRAFKAYHGVLPSAVRAGAATLRSCPRLSFQLTVKGAEHMDYQIKNYPAFTVAGFCQQLKTEQAFEIVPQIWAAARVDGRMERLLTFMQQTDYYPAGLLGIAISGQWGASEEMTYLLGVTNAVDTPEAKHVTPPAELQEFRLPPATWVILPATGDLPDSVQNIYKHFYAEWLPSSGYHLADLPVVECYLEDRQEVWIAVTTEK